MLFILILCGASAAFACGVLVRSGRQIAHRYSLDMPQRFHVGHVPRLGGVAMMSGCAAGWLWMVLASRYFGVHNGIQLTPGEALGWVLPALIASGAGSAEDIWHTLQARWRLVFTLAAGLLAAWLLGGRIDRVGLTLIDNWWSATPWLPALLAVLAVAGLPHAFNLIDGYNGLAGAIALVCCVAIAYVALQVGDRQIAGAVLVLAGATAGFLPWNYPRGLIFAGDGGAYLWGAVIAIACIVLVQRHPQVSPWFPMLLLAYPVGETFFSIYRKVARGQSASMADALHIHQLIYRRIVREVFHDDEARRVLTRNNRTTPYLCSFAAFTVLPAALFWNNTPLLMTFFLAFVALYIWAYISIVRFKVPRWLRRGL
jgi:UDP-GlcNAc:undecaprenyl-phosphate GlcNAc-1-phosphate transferase